jgi:hypothetical protein
MLDYLELKQKKGRQKIHVDFTFINIHQIFLIVYPFIIFKFLIKN